jgi:hypothetical protein
MAAERGDEASFTYQVADDFGPTVAREKPKENDMTLKRYFPISVAAFILIIVGAYYTSLPVIPFIVLGLIGETLLGFQCEDHRALRFLQTLWTSLKSAH